MRILSVYPLPGTSWAHDGNVCLADEHEVLFAGEEERWHRAQHAIGYFPERAAILGLKACGQSPSQIDRLVTTSIESCGRQPDFHQRLRYVRELLQIPDQTPALCLPHHLAHSALAVLTSPFDECIFLTLDGGGDGHMGHWGIFRNSRFRILETLSCSPAFLYQFLTCRAGFPLFEEGKTMGLAGYGQADEQFLGWLRSHFRIVDGSARLETDLTFRWTPSLALDRANPDAYARHKFLRWDLDCRRQEDAWIDDIPPPDIARTGQTFFEELLVNIVENVSRRSGLQAIACAGGAFHNVVATGRLHRHFDKMTIHVPVAPHDAGLALGAALWTRHINGSKRLPHPLTPLLGSAFSPAEVERTLDTFGLAYARPENFPKAVAELVAAGLIVGWFDGRAEYGARALGARSVLGDPRRVDSQVRLNRLLKRRDWFMPFAPSVLEEHGDQLFEQYTASPYMNIALRVRPAMAPRLAGAVHVDGTCRPQTVTQAMHPRFHALIASFHEMTGVPAVLNTSFNRHGLPMVATPRDAVVHLLEGCVEALAIEGFVVRSDRRQPTVQRESTTESVDLMLLRHAARLVQHGQAAGAVKVLARIDRAFALDSEHIAYRGHRIWQRSEPTAHLEQWWHDFHAQR